MAPRALVYTSLDYPAILAELRANAASEATLAGLDLAEGSTDQRWFVAVATVGAKLSYYLNRWANEGYITRARLRQSVIDHAAGLGYELASPTPAVVTVTVTLPRSYTDAVVIAEGTEIPTDDGSVTYTTDADATIIPGASFKTIACTEGRRIAETAIGEPSSTSPAGQRVDLAESPFVAESEVVTVDGVAWTRVRNFLSSLATSNHYRVERDATDQATVVFGDATNGRRPTEGASIAITYRTCSGSAGRVRRGALRRILGSFRTTGGLPVEPTVTNAGDSSGGTDRETIEHARYAAPESLRATTRTVSREDFELHAIEVGGVDRALAHTRIEDASLPYLLNRVYIVPTGGGTADAALLAAVETYVTVTKPCTAGYLVQVVSAHYATQTVTATITCRAGTDDTTLATDAVAAVEALFDPAARDADGNYLARFGLPVPRSAIIAALQGLTGVTVVDLTSPATDATFTAIQFPALASSPAITVVTELAS